MIERFFVPKERLRATVKRLLEERNQRSKERFAEMEKNFVCIIKKEE